VVNLRGCGVCFLFDKRGQAQHGKSASAVGTNLVDIPEY